MKKFKNKKKYINNKKNDNKKFNIVSVISMVLIVLICSSILIFVGFSMYIYMNAPEFDTSLLYKNESSNIYDNKGDLIASIGSEKRQIVKYDELPEVLIDAIVATEDSRFFIHDGVDIYRFTKAGLGYLIVYGGQVFKLDLVMTSVIILGILAGIMYGAVLLIEKFIQKRI